MQKVNIFFTFLDTAANYFTLQLVRCAIFSVFILLLIMALRSAFKNKVFLKGFLWNLILITPFIGKLKIFYENALCVRATWWWTNLCMGNFPISRIYFTGIIATGFILIRRRRKLNRLIKNFKTKQLDNSTIFVCSQNISPFTTGIFAPKIVMPEIIFKEYRQDEINIILQHEKNHIRLWHLLFYLIWDALHALMWINPLFTVCLKYFKADMEDICDRVTIKQIGCTGNEYGQILLNSIKLLQNDMSMQNENPTFTFAKNRHFSEVKHRIKMSACYREYKRALLRCATGLTVFLTVFLLAIISGNSYARYQLMQEVYIYDIKANMLVMDCDELREAITYDKDYFYVDTERFRKILKDNDIAEQQLIISFGGYYKLPGIGGGRYCNVIETEMLNSDTAKIPYESSYDLYTWLMKYL